MAWGTMNVQEQRVRFVVAASRREKTMTALCREFEISRPTGYHWLARYRSGGIAAISQKSRRPERSPTRTAPELEQRVIQERLKKPDWGARKLSTVLGRDQGIQLTPFTVHRILKRNGMIAASDELRPAIKRFERSQPNQMWQMDFKSPTGWHAPVGPLTLLDDHSRYAIALKGTWTTQAEPVKQGLIEAFERCGMPEEILMDHGTPWWNMKSPTGWTWLTVWMMKQGIRLRFSGYRHPQTQGKVERFHGAMDRAIRRRGVPAIAARQRWLDEFRNEYNQERPHEALGMKTPAEVWKKSLRSWHPDRERQWQYEVGAEVHKLSNLGQLQLQGRRWLISQALAREWVKLERIEERVLVFYRRSLVGELDAPTQRSTMVDRWVSTPQHL
jgi:transposase InsO family protein